MVPWRKLRNSTSLHIQRSFRKYFSRFFLYNSKVFCLLLASYYCLENLHLFSVSLSSIKASNVTMFTLACVIMMKIFFIFAIHDWALSRLKPHLNFCWMFLDFQSLIFYGFKFFYSYVLKRFFILSNIHDVCSVILLFLKEWTITLVLF